VVDSITARATRDLADDFASGTLSAAFGGNTTILPFCLQEKGTTLRESLKGVKAEVEFYPKVEHGFAFPQRPAYNKDAAERHWERLFALWRRNL